MLPKILQVGPFTLYSFGLMVILGFMVGAYLGSKLARERGLPGDTFFDGAVIILFASIAGARLLFVALNWREYSQHLTNVMALWQGGMSFHGGAIAGVGAGMLYMRFRKVPVLPMADVAAPGLAIGYAIGRIGCFLNGCCYGGPTTLPWGVHFPQMEAGARCHPVQIYATVLNLLLTAALIAYCRRDHRNGQVLAAFVAGYSVYRFLVEGLRKGISARELAFGLTEAQVFSVVCLVAAGAWWAWLQKRGTDAPPLVETTQPAPAAT